MGGGVGAIATVFSSVLGMGQKDSGPSREDIMAEEKARREEEKRQEEAKERRDERQRKKEAKLQEKNRLKAAQNRSTLLSKGSSDVEAKPAVLKRKLGE